MRTGDIAIATILAILGMLLGVQVAKQSATQRELAAQTTALLQAAEAMGNTAEVWKSAKEDVSGDPLLAAAMELSRVSDPQIRMSAAEILGCMGGDEAVARLREMAEKDTRCRFQALEGLRKAGNPDAAMIALDIIRNGNREDRQNAANLLGAMISPNILPDVIELLDELPYTADSMNASLRRSIYSAMQRLGDPKACPALLKALVRETDQSSQRYLGEALVACAGRNEIGLLCQALETLPPPRQNHYESGPHGSIVRALGQLGDLRATEALINYLKSEDRNLARYALEAIARLRDPLAAKALCELDTEDSTLREYRNRYLREGFPGIRNNDGKFELVPEEEMKELLRRREEFIKRLEDVEQPDAE